MKRMRKKKQKRAKLNEMRQKKANINNPFSDTLAQDIFFSFRFITSQSLSLAKFLFLFLRNFTLDV